MSCNSTVLIWPVLGILTGAMSTFSWLECIVDIPHRVYVTVAIAEYHSFLLFAGFLAESEKALPALQTAYCTSFFHTALFKYLIECEKLTAFFELVSAVA